MNLPPSDFAAAVDPELEMKLRLFTRMKADAKAYQSVPKWGGF